jgi:hypothetical protein
MWSAVDAGLVQPGHWHRQPALAKAIKRLALYSDEL